MSAKNMTRKICCVSGAALILAGCSITPNQGLSLVEENVSKKEKYDGYHYVFSNGATVCRVKYHEDMHDDIYDIIATVDYAVRSEKLKEKCDFIEVGRDREDEGGQPLYMYYYDRASYPKSLFNEVFSASDDTSSMTPICGMSPDNVLHSYGGELKRHPEDIFGCDYVSISQFNAITVKSSLVFSEPGQLAPSRLETLVYHF